MATFSIRAGGNKSRNGFSKKPTDMTGITLSKTLMYRTTRGIGLLLSLYNIVVAGFALAEFPGRNSVNGITTKSWMWIVSIPILWSVFVYLTSIFFTNRGLRESSRLALRGKSVPSLFNLHAIDSAVNSAVNFAFIFIFRSHFKQSEIDAFDNNRYNDALAAPLDTNMYISWAVAMTLVMLTGKSEITAQFQFMLRDVTNQKS